MDTINDKQKNTKKLHKRKVILVGAILALAAASVVALLYIFPSLRIRSLGIQLKPTKDIPLQQITYYLQNDPVWSKDTIGDTKIMLGGEGCLISCVSAAVTEMMDEPLTPQELNNMMTQIDGYEGASLIWYKIHEAIPSLDYSTARVFSNKTIEADLENGLLPIVRVKMYGMGATHWVLIIGAHDGQFMIFDPLKQDKQPIPLSTHGNVYAYRVIKKY
jgi:hypothetical protein